MENINALQIIALEEAKQEWLSLKKVRFFFKWKGKKQAKRDPS